MIEIRPVILCGGSGTRLWPLSRAGFPKQFLSLQGKTSLFQNAVQRMLNLASDEIHFQDHIVVTHEEHRFIALEQLREMQLKQASLLLEPVARNTAAALTLAALHASQAGRDTVLVVTPSDHHVGDVNAFVASLTEAVRCASTDAITIMGIRPTRAETGYGYVQAKQLSQGQSSSQVIRFVEKPTLPVAEQYLASGDYVWNGGLFILKASVWLRALNRFRPDIEQACRLAWHQKSQDDLFSGFSFLRPDAQLFSQVPSESVDFAVMEKCPGSDQEIRIVALDADWSDLGAWDAIWQVEQKDAQGNACTGDVLLDQAQDNLVHASHRLVSVVGVSNLAIVETADAVLVADKSNSQHVKNIVAKLEKLERQEHKLHRQSHRPWGWSMMLEAGEGFKVNRLILKPDASISLQKHEHRAEHWIVVKGTAEVTDGESKSVYQENQSTAIATGHLHQLKNIGQDDLHIIEVQSGDQLLDDDIIRMQS